MNEPRESDELFELFSELVDGDLKPSRAERLRELLRDNADAQDLYLNYMRIHAQLHLAYDSGSGLADMPGGSSMPLKPLSTPPFEQAGVSHFDVGFESTDVVGPSTRLWPLASAIGWGLAVVLAIGLVFMLRPAGSQKAPAVLRLSRKVDVSDGVAVVVRAVGVRWETSDGWVPKEGDVLPRGRLKVYEGRAMLSMLSGVAVVVEGPADIELLSVDRIACNHGKLRARVPEGAEGFAVSGPGSAVVDLGTEFGVNIKRNGKSRGKVFEGEVEAAVLGTSGSLRRSRVVKKESEAFEIDPGAGLIEPFKGPEDFVTPSNLTPALLTLAPGYRSAILDSKPRCYWRFESAEKGKVPNEVSGQPPLVVTGPIQFAGTSEDNRCAVFGPGQPTQYLQMEGLWRPERSPGFAVELWFLSETIAHAALVSLVAPKDTTHHLSLVELTSSNRLVLFRPASVRFLYRWPAGRDFGDNMFSNDIYVPYRWHHLVSQIAGDRMELYLNGVRQTSLPIDPVSSTTACQLVLGRLSTLVRADFHHTGYRRPFVGLMDEVALYDRPLSAEEVRARHRLATQTARPD